MSELPNFDVYIPEDFFPEQIAYTDKRLFLPLNNKWFRPW